METRKLNIGCGKMHMDGYVNCDLRRIVGSVDVQFNAFVFPWPFQDESFDELYASHLVEHIPHTVRQWQPAKLRTLSFDPQRTYYVPAKLEPNWDEDGFFIFFREAWRILKPGGSFTLVGPYHRSTGADQDPTHTRYITENTFSYLWQVSEQFDYELGFKFDQETFQLNITPAWLDIAHNGATNEKANQNFTNAFGHFWNVADSFETRLRKAALA